MRGSFSSPNFSKSKFVNFFRKSPFFFAFHNRLWYDILDLL